VKFGNIILVRSSPLRVFPDAGIKVSQVAGLSEELSLALEQNQSGSSEYQANHPSA